MTHLRPLRRGDLEKIDQIWREHHQGRYGLPTLNNVVDAQIIMSGNDVVGAGVVKLFAEGVLVLDKNFPLATRAKGVITAIEHGIDVVRREGLEQFHLFSDDPHYCEVLQKHWGFRTAPGTMLFRESE